MPISISDINDMWSKDSVIDRMNVGNISLETAQLHQKYLAHLISEKLTLMKLESEYKVLTRAKTEYYKGSMDEAELRVRGWEPNRLRIMNTDIPTYVGADEDIITLSLKIGLYREKVGMLNEIIKNLNNRKYDVKNFIDWTRFTNGQ